MSVCEQLAACREGAHPGLIARVASGFVILFEQQYLPGYCVLIADPLVGALNDLDAARRVMFLEDLAALGDAIPRALGAAGIDRPFRRMNYAMLGNVDPTLHAHAMPRFEDEPAGLRDKAYWAFPPGVVGPEHAFDPARHTGLAKALREALAGRAVR